MVAEGAVLITQHWRGGESQLVRRESAIDDGFHVPAYSTRGAPPGARLD
jgi:hypothetical protein